MRCRNTRTGIRNLLECSISEVSEENARRLIRIGWKLFFDSGVHTSSYKEDVRPTVVVQIKNPRSPTRETGLNAKFRLQSSIVKIARAIVVVQHICVLCKVSFEEVQVAIQVVITDSDSHSRFFATVAAQGNTTLNPFLFESPVVLVDEQQAGCRVASYVYVRPTVLVEVRRHDGHSVTRPVLPYSRLNTDVSKSSITVVSI